MTQFAVGDRVRTLHYDRTKIARPWPHIADGKDGVVVGVTAAGYVRVVFEVEFPYAENELEPAAEPREEEAK
jgi:hypothetical protein